MGLLSDTKGLAYPFTLRAMRELRQDPHGNCTTSRPSRDRGPSHCWLTGQSAPSSSVLADGIRALCDGAGALHDETGVLCNSIGALHDGTGALHNGIWIRCDRVGTLHEGAGALYNGIGAQCATDPSGKSPHHPTAAVPLTPADLAQHRKLAGGLINSPQGCGAKEYRQRIAIGRQE